MERGPALWADGIRVKGNIFIHAGFRAQGGVRLIGADIGLNLDCRAAQLHNEGDSALSADGIRVTGDVHFSEGFEARGEIRLHGAVIGGDIASDGARILNRRSGALSFPRASIRGNVSIALGFHAVGSVEFHGAEILGDLDCTGAILENPDGVALSAEMARIGGGMLFRNVNVVASGAVDFSHAKVGVLVDDKASWPDRGFLHLNRFEYGRIGGHSVPVDAISRLNWLARQPSSDFRPQPHRQLAKVLSEMGHESDARAVHINRHRETRKRSGLSPSMRAWSYFYEWTTGFGYQPWRLLVLVAALVFLGSIVFDIAARLQMFVGVGPEPRPPFIAFLYSFDVLIPFVNFQQEARWMPRASGITNLIFYAYFLTHKAFGWYACVMGAAAVTGLLRKD